MSRSAPVSSVRRPSPAMIVALIALFISLGGSAAAAVIITSNSQVAAHTIAGAGGARGLNQNLIPGSVAGSDVATGTLTAANVASANKDGTAATPSLRTLGSGAQQAMPGNAKPDPTIRTVLIEQAFASDTAPANTPKLLVSVGQFTKRQAASAAIVTWSGHVTALGGTSNALCGFQLRIDGQAPTGNAGWAVTGQTPAFGSPVGVTAVFSGLSAGTHTVSIYDMGGSVSSCNINPAQFPETVLVEEQL